MQEKTLIGFVIFNKNNQFLFTRNIQNNVVDYGLVCEETTQEATEPILNNILKENLCLNINTSKALSVLIKGTDSDGKFIIYKLKLDVSSKNMFSIKNNKTEFLWLTMPQIQKLHAEKKLNNDQINCINQCFNIIKEENSLIKKATHQIKTTKKEKHKIIYSNPDEEFKNYVDKFTDRRLLARIINKRKVKPCGKECYEYGYLIAQSWHHSSFENFQDLMNDEEFVLSAAEITPNPVECGNYFYLYVNHHLRRKSSFRLEFLKQVYLNLNVNKLEDINLIVESLDLQKENKIILNDLEFKKIIEKKFDKILKKTELKYHCSGLSKKELHQYKVTANDIKVMLENIKKGLTDIVNSFTVGEKIEEPEFTPNTFYEHLCMLSSKTVKEKPTTEYVKPKQEKVEVDNYEPTNYYEFLCKQNRTKNL